MSDIQKAVELFTQVVNQKDDELRKALAIEVELRTQLEEVRKCNENQMAFILALQESKKTLESRVKSLHEELASWRNGRNDIEIYNLKSALDLLKIRHDQLLDKHGMLQELCEKFVENFSEIS